MTITIEDNKINVGSIGKFNDDGSDLNEEKLLELLSKISKKEEVEIDEKLIGDDRKKCELIKEIIETYINEYFSE